jgi:hypothetical protein
MSAGRGIFYPFPLFHPKNPIISSKKTHYLNLFINFAQIGRNVAKETLRRGSTYPFAQKYIPLRAEVFAQGKMSAGRGIFYPFPLLLRKKNVAKG